MSDLCCAVWTCRCCVTKERVDFTFKPDSLLQNSWERHLNCMALLIFPAGKWAKIASGKSPGWQNEFKTKSSKQAATGKLLPYLFSFQSDAFLLVLLPGSPAKDNAQGKHCSIQHSSQHSFHATHENKRANVFGTAQTRSFTRLGYHDVNHPEHHVSVMPYLGGTHVITGVTITHAKRCLFDDLMLLIVCWVFPVCLQWLNSGYPLPQITALREENARIQRKVASGEGTEELAESADISQKAHSKVGQP